MTITQSPTPPDPSNTPSGVFELVNKTANNTKVQWVVIGAFLVSFGAFVQYVFNKADMVNSAMAQSQATTNTNTRDVEHLKARIETIDSGTRGDVQRLERKIDTNNEEQNKKIDKIMDKVTEVLKEIKKR